jgi:hypothetical protein
MQQGHPMAEAEPSRSQLPSPKGRPLDPCWAHGTFTMKNAKIDRWKCRYCEDGAGAGVITGVEYVKGGYDASSKKRFAGGWRAAITQLELQEDGSWGVPEDGGTSTNYEINAELINMIIQCPLNGFLAFHGAGEQQEESDEEG